MGPMQLPLMPPVAPMLAKAVPSLPDGALMFEPKWDGFRSIIFRDGGDVEIGSRNGKPLTRYFPELVEALKANLPPRCVLDGEIILVGASGDRLDFDALQQRIHPAASRVRLLADQTPASFVAFDLLALDDEDFTGRPFAERRGALERVLAGSAAPIHLTAATRDRETAGEWFHQFEGAGLDGIVAKPLDGPLPAGQALHVQDQARTHRRLRPRRVPGAHVRPGPGRFAAAGTLRRRRKTRQRGRGGGLPAAAPQGTFRGTSAAGDQLRGPPLGLGPAGGRAPVHRATPRAAGGAAARTSPSRRSGRSVWWR